jgi:hypothetical protein
MKIIVECKHIIRKYKPHAKLPTSREIGDWVPWDPIVCIGGFIYYWTCPICKKELKTKGWDFRDVINFAIKHFRNDHKIEIDSDKYVDIYGPFQCFWECA